MSLDWVLINSSTEVPKPPDKQQTAANSPMIRDSQDEDPSHMIELLPMSTMSSAGQLTHEQYGEVADEDMVRVDTEHYLAHDHRPAEQSTLRNSHLRTSHLPTVAWSDNSLTAEASPTWRAHHQDFYLSKWFRSILISIIVLVNLVAFLVYLFVSPLFDIDLFSTDDVYISPATFFGPILIILCISIGGIFWSKVFK